MKTNKKKASAVIAGIFALVMIITSIGTITASAEVIYEEQNPIFQNFKLYNGKMTILTDYYEPEGELTQYDEATDSYSITTNAFAMWEQQDHIAYAFNDYSLAYGDQSKITIETEILSHQPVDEGKTMHENASIGICMRSDDDMSSKEIYLHCRSNLIQMVYRSKDGANTAYCGQNFSIPISSYPLYLKMERSGNAIRCSVRFADSDKWQSFPTQYINLGDTIVAGMAAHACYRDIPIISKFTNYHVTVEGPEGSQYTPPGGNEEEEEKVENPLPEDPKVTDDILFRETFTDGSFTNKSEDGKEHVDNPIWTDQYSIDGYIEGATIETEGDNRFWHRNFSSDTYFFPNNEWTDYSMSVDLKFGEETIADGDNMVDLYVRFRAARDTGFYGYRFAFSNGKNIILYKIGGRRDPQMTAMSCAQTEFNYIDYDWCTWKVTAFDNVLTLSRIGADGVETEVLSFTDLSQDGNFSVNAKGGIGIGSNGADIYVDNIIVRKIVDLMGGDWDNTIGGNWDDPIPDYIRDYKYEIIEEDQGGLDEFVVWDGVSSSGSAEAGTLISYLNYDSYSGKKLQSAEFNINSAKLAGSQDSYMRLIYDYTDESNYHYFMYRFTSDGKLYGSLGKCENGVLTDEDSGKFVTAGSTALSLGCTAGVTMGSPLTVNPLLTPKDSTVSDYTVKVQYIADNKVEFTFSNNSDPDNSVSFAVTNLTPGTNYSGTGNKVLLYTSNTAKFNSIDISFK